MSHDFVLPPRNTQIHYAPAWAPRQQNSFHVPGARSPGRRTRVPRAPDTPARGNPDIFTHQGTSYVLMRFYPGDEPAEPLDHRRVTAEIPTTSGTLVLPVEVTARTPYLVHVTWIDDSGEILGTWCPSSMVRTENEPQD